MMSDLRIIVFVNWSDACNIFLNIQKYLSTQKYTASTTGKTNIMENMFLDQHYIYIYYIHKFKIQRSFTGERKKTLFFAFTEFYDITAENAQPRNGKRLTKPNFTVPIARAI